MTKQENSPGGSPDAGNAERKDRDVKVSSWVVVQNEILSKIRDASGNKSDNSLTLQHAPQLLHKLECSGNVTSMTHFPITTGEMFTCQASISAREHRTLAWKLAHNNTLKEYSFKCPTRITQLIFIPKCRVYVGYSPTKLLRVFLDPESGCEEVFTIPCVSVLTCMAYNKETEEIIGGGKGFVETWKVSGKEYRTSLQKGKKLELTISKDAEVTEMKVDLKNSQVFVVSEKGMLVINYRTSSQTHIMVNRHSGKLCRCCIYHDGEYLITGSTDGTIKIWNSVVYTQVHEFSGHSGPVTALQGHRKEPLLFSASSDGSVYVWRLDSFQKYMTLDLGAKVMTMKLLTDTTLFCQTDTDVSIYSLNQFHQLFVPFEAPVLKLQRMRCFGNHPNRILVSTEDGFVQLVSPVTGATITSMNPLPGCPNLNTFIYNSREQSLYTILADGEVVVLNTTRNPLRAAEILEPPMRDKKVTSLAIMKVKAGSLDKEMEDTLIFMGMKNGQISVLESYCMIMDDQVDAHQGEVTCLASSAEVDTTMMGLLPTSRFLVSGGADNCVRIWGLEFSWDEEEEGYNVKVFLVQKLDCSGTPSHIAMFENVICVALGAYGMTKMFRLGGLRADLQNQGAIGLAVALTHNSVYDHSDEVMSLDMCPPVGLFLTCSKDGFVKVWDSDNQPVRDMNFGRPILAACFANNRGDILVGLLNRTILIPMTNYLPHDHLERLAQRVFKDEERENPIPYKAVKTRKKHWFDRKSLPKFSTDLQKRISEKVQMHSDLFSDMMDGKSLTLERMNTDMSLATELAALDDLEDAEQFNAAIEAGDIETRSTELSKTRRRTRGSVNLGKGNFGELKEEEEDVVPALQRRTSVANFRKRSSWANITPRVLKDLELAAKRKRLSIVSAMPAAPVINEEEQKKRKDEEKKALALKREKEEREAEQIKQLPEWEQFLLKRKPIIALDGYIPNSVVRAAIGFVKPKSPEPVWRLKPVPKVNPKHLPEGWKMKTDTDTPTRRMKRENATLEKDMDIKSVMSLKRESTLQSIKQQQSYKDASMYIGTVYCLLPDGTEPESVPNFQWCTSKEDVVDLSVAVKVKVITPPPKKATVITAVPQKTTPIKRNTPEVQQPPAFKSTQKIAQKNVSIDLSANMDMRVASRPQPVRDLPQPKREKSLSFRLPTAGTASATLIEEPAEEEKQQFEAEYESQDEEQKPKTAGSQKRELSMERTQPHAQGNKSGLARTPGKAPPLPRNLTEQELGLLQKIVKEDWFPQGVLPAFEPVMDVLLSFVDKGEIKVYTKVCDYIVAIAKEIGIPQRYLNRCGDKLSKQSSHTAALIRKKSLWTLRQLGINRKDLISAILPGLADAKDDIREEAIAALNDLMGEQGQQGLSDLMTSLGMSKPLNTKEERQAALKAISEKLTTGDKKGGKGAGWDTAKEKIQMWVGSLTAIDPTSSYEAKAAEVQKQSSRWDTFTPGASRGSRASMTFSELDSDMDEEEFVRTKSGRYYKPSRQRTSLSRKSTGKQESNVSERVEQGTGMSPPHRKGDKIPTTRADEEYLFKRYERYGSEYFDAGGTDEDDEDIYGSRAQFLPIDQDFTPTMFRSDTGESLWSDDNLPSLIKTESSRPRGASIQNFHARQEQATTVGQQTDGRRRRYWPQDRSGKLADYDSDVHSVSQYETDQEGGTHRYETDREGGTHRTTDGTDIMSMADSGIVSDISSHVHPRDSLYKQGLPTLSPITSQSQLAGERPKKKVPEWRDFFETPAAQQRKQKKKGKGKGKEEEKESVKEGKVVFTSNNLPPITYINTEQPTTAGEAGMRCLHSIRVVDKERADSEKHKIESVPGRLTMHTQDQSAGETSYGLLQMTWTTNVPALPILPETRGEALVPKDIMQPWDAALPRLMQPGLWTQQNAESLMNELQKNLPGIKGDRGQDFQWKRPLPAAKVASRHPLAERPDRHQCEHIRLAKKKMHHFTSGKNRQLFKDDTTISMKTEPSQHLLSMIRQSSMSFLPPAPLQDVIRHIAANAEINAS